VLGFSASIMYYPHIATVIEKRRADGRVYYYYYYLVESARVDGKPRIVSQQYLGSAAEIAEKLAGAQASAPARSQHKRFGALAAVWSVLERVGVVEVTDAVVARRADASASVGTCLALACANRIVEPCSKLGFADWWATTAGPRQVKLPPPREIIAGSGRGWTGCPRPACARSRPSWVGGSSPSTAWTPPVWCWA
jgi:hypothetical protein